MEREEKQSCCDEMNQITREKEEKGMDRKCKQWSSIQWWSSVNGIESKQEAREAGTACHVCILEGEILRTLLTLDSTVCLSFVAVALTVWPALFATLTKNPDERTEDGKDMRFKLREERKRWTSYDEEWMQMKHISFFFSLHSFSDTYALKITTQEPGKRREERFKCTHHLHTHHQKILPNQ